MSRSPEEALPAREAEDYSAAFRAVFRMHEKGKSFSGRERNCVFLNTGAAGGERFADVSRVSGLDFADDGRGLALVDWDHDGDLDLWAANRTAPRLRLLRNDSPPGSAFLALRLVGTRVNRDAVGSRVEVVSRGAEGERMLQISTVRAGQGFLSQSSRWQHFGLADRELEVVRITWPDGQRQTLRSLAPGRRYEITQGCPEGSPTCREEPPRALPSRRVALEAGALPAAPEATPERVFLGSRIPVPALAYRDLASGESWPAPVGGRPLLLNLWASWCLPCAGELSELGARWEELEGAGLGVLALSVDGLDAAKATDAGDARRFLERRPVPFAAGLARAQDLDRLQILLDRLFSKQILLAVPTSFLLDAQGRLAALYRGPVEVDRLLEDVRSLGRGAEARRERQAPFRGRWLEEPGALRLTTIAQRFLDEGHPEDALAYLRSAVGESPGDAEILTSLGHLLRRLRRPGEARQAYARALGADPSRAAAARGLGELAAAAGRWRDAETYYRQAISASPELLEARLDLASVLRARGDLPGAIQTLRRALELRPDLAAGHNNLGALLLEAGELEAAAGHLERALALDPALADAHMNLGILALGAGRHEPAIAHLERAVVLRPDSPEAHNNLGVAFLRAGLPARAAEAFEAALALRTDYQAARENLATARARQ